VQLTQWSSQHKPPFFSGREDVLPSASMGFINIESDGKHKNRHNEELLFLLKLLQQAGCKYFLTHHVKDGGMTKSLPLMLDHKWYDLSYVSSDGEIFLIEIMRLRKIFVENPEKVVL
jgi:hypothetical protein